MRAPVIFALTILVSVQSNKALTADRLHFYTENFPPYNMSASGGAFEHSEKEIDGLCTEMVKAIMAQTQLGYVIKLRNWDYGYKRAQEKPNHGIFCTTFTEDRAAQFEWIGPLATNLWTIFAPKGSTLKMTALEDAKGKTIGGYHGDVMTQYLVERGYKVAQIESDDLNPKRLVLKQIDLWIADRLAGPYFASQQDVEDLVPVYSFNETELFLAVNPDTSPEIISALKTGLEKVKSSGMFSAIQEKYGL